MGTIQIIGGIFTIVSLPFFFYLILNETIPFLLGGLIYFFILFLILVLSLVEDNNRL